MHNIEQDADALVATYYTAPNGHGQHVHPERGSTDRQLLTMWEKYGQYATELALNAAFDRFFAQKRRADQCA